MKHPETRIDFRPFHISRKFVSRSSPLINNQGHSDVVNQVTFMKSLYLSLHIHFFLENIYISSLGRCDSIWLKQFESLNQKNFVYCFYLFIFSFKTNLIDEFSRARDTNENEKSFSD